MKFTEYIRTRKVIQRHKPRSFSDRRCIIVFIDHPIISAFFIPHLGSILNLFVFLPFHIFYSRNHTVLE